MASYRPFPLPPQSTFAPRPPPPTLPPQQQQNWGYSQIPSNPNYQNLGFLSSSQQHHQQPPYQYPPPENSYPPPPPPPAPTYYPSGQFSQYSQHQPLQPLQPPPPPPPPPSSPPPSSVAPPPPPPVSPPPRPLPIRNAEERRTSGDGRDKAAVPPVPMKKSIVPPGRVEAEKERRLRKKREYEKLRQEEKHRQHIKESQNRVLQKTQMLASGTKGHGSVAGSHMGDRKTAPLLSGERVENRLKKPTTFLCKLK